MTTAHAHRARIAELSAELDRELEALHRATPRMQPEAAEAVEFAQRIAPDGTAVTLSLLTYATLVTASAVERTPEELEALEENLATVLSADVLMRALLTMTDLEDGRFDYRTADTVRDELFRAIAAKREREAPSTVGPEAFETAVDA